ncbi:MAG: hypothetical protein KJ950_17350 [Proteobacteria bacterium]|nr:hypothetical protein [Pseudomonadota bacterium]MBU1689026.1 hypothetical protein [Pseudomonadota bacterium]
MWFAERTLLLLWSQAGLPIARLGWFKKVLRRSGIHYVFVAEAGVHDSGLKKRVVTERLIFH